MTRTMLKTATLAGAALFLFACAGEFEPTRIELRSDVDEFVAGKPAKLRVIGIDADGEKQEISEGVTFQSSDERLATVDAKGDVTVLKGGDVTFTAAVDSMTAELSTRTGCEYPKYGAKIEYNRVFPKLAWPAKRPDGSEFEFKMDEVHCDLEWADTKTLTLVLSAGWCAPCTRYAQMLSVQRDELNAAGMEIAIIEVQDKGGEPADLSFAWDHLLDISPCEDGSIPCMNEPKIAGIVAGDKDTRPQASFLEDSGLIKAFPTVLVVRTEDMRIIADQSRANNYLPLADIAADPHADWSKSGNPVFVNRCDPDDEEDQEPNNVPAQAKVLPLGTLEGGICEEGNDLYRIEIEGEWTATLEFEHSVGDLDLFLWEEGRNQELLIDNKAIYSANGTNVETITWSGPAMLAVVPYRAASAPYKLTLTKAD